MKLKEIFKTSRHITFEVENGSIFETDTQYEVYIDGSLYKKDNRVISSIYDLKPDSEYEIKVKYGDEEAMLNIKTEYEFVTLNVRDFGAYGDGVHDDTKYIQAAIMACPKQSRVLIPQGVYRITTLFLKDDIQIELSKDAQLSAYTDRNMYPVFPGMIESYDEKHEYNLGTWEGNPLSMYSAIITGVNIKNVILYGQGTIEGNSNFDEDNWWYNAKVKRGAFRPRMIFLNHCENVVVQGIKVQNSPSWNIHPYFSNHLKFIDITVLNPKDSPNTDGLDPESCNDVEIAGVYFSLGDDCIAIKSGKIYMGATYKTPSENIIIRQCCMRDGHGSITIGSEMAGGVKNLTVKECKFLHTDRGLRIKTRRGRGKDAVIDNILFENIQMDNVMTPFVINSFYFCDPDGHTEYVRTREVLPVDERTPEINTLIFKDIDARNCHVAASWMCGLPEKKIRRVRMENINITYAENAKSGEPAMMEGINECSRRGIYAENIEVLELKNICIKGQTGDKIEAVGTKLLELSN